MEGRTRKFLDRLLKNYHLSITDRVKLIEVFSISVSRFKFIVTLFLYSTIVFIMTLVLYSYTPLRFHIPGYPSREVWKAMYYNAKMLDSLQAQIELRDNYFASIQSIIEGQVVDSSIDTTQIIPEASLEPMKDDSIFDQLIGADQYKFKFDAYGETDDLTNISFFKPITGVVVNRFEASPGHYGSDIVGKLHSNICAVLNGTVIFAEWTISTGYVIQIQHKYNLVTVYKHNSELLVKQGEHVFAGQVIAIMGDEGELSSGPHLHFELWRNGKPLDPENYITFN